MGQLGLIDTTLLITMLITNQRCGPRSIMLTTMLDITVPRETVVSEPIAVAVALLSPIRIFGNSALAMGVGVICHQMQAIHG
jgi:hypothetical protein